MENLELLHKRAKAANNDRQHNRMIMDKLRGFHRALLYSYQACWVKNDRQENAEWHRALMNPDKVKFDYDEKILSIDFESGFQPGDTFEWGKDTGSHWMILKSEDTEIAYFRANCRRCHYLTARDPETHELFSQWAVIRGPVETKLNVIQKAGIVVDVPNLTLELYLRDTEQNRRTFERYKRFEFNGRYWKVQAPDFISTPGVLDIQAEEDYKCEADEMFVEPVEENTNVEQMIDGPISVKPMEPAVFTCYQAGDWSITLPAEKNKEITDVLDYKIIGDMIKVTWTALLSGSYIIKRGDAEKTVLVESLF